MAMMRGTTVAFVVLVLAAVVDLASGTIRDGLPRPDGYPDVPTEDYGPTPACLDANGVQATCEWYGFSHNLYPAEGADCNSVMRQFLSNTTLYPPGKLTPYLYYLNTNFVFDPATNGSYCLYGCFDLTNTAAAAPSPLASSPSPSPIQLAPRPLAEFSAPPPAGVAPPPLDVVAPSPLEISSPPPAVVLARTPEFSPPPPPATLFTPPAAASTPPSPAVATPLSPPVAMPPSPLVATPPSAPVATPPVASPPDAVQANLNGARFLRPSGFLSFILSVALLSFVGITAF